MADLGYSLTRKNVLGRADWTKEDEFFINFENPRSFVIERWNAAVDTYKISNAEHEHPESVTDPQTWEEYMRNTLTEVRVAGKAPIITPLISISRLFRPLWFFQNLIQDVEEDLQDVTEEIDVSPLWSMAYLNIKLSLDSVEKIRKTAWWMNEFRRQIQLLNSSLKPSGDDRRPMRIEMSEIFDPVLGIMHDSITYLQRYHFEDDFVKNWQHGQESKIKLYIEALAGTVKHIRDMGATSQINRIGESRLAELGIRERQYITDGPEKAIFPVNTLPPLRKDYFTGRRKEIERIHRWLSSTEVTRLRTYLIYGRRGIGKTMIALEFAALHKKEYDAIFWVQCETSASLRQSFAEIATSLELDGADKNGHFEENLMKVLRWLRTTSKRWLLIYDNAERENLLKGFWPQGAKGSILLTSRSYYNFFEDDQRGGETVPCFSLDESHKSLMLQLGEQWEADHFGPQNLMADMEKVAANILLTKTGGLPLAITHAAKLIIDRNIGMKRAGGDDTIRGFLELFGESSAKLPKRPMGKGVRDPLIHSLDTIWSIAFDALSENALAILSVLAFISPDVILIDLFLPSDENRLTKKLEFCRTEESEFYKRPSIQTVVKPSSGLQQAFDELVDKSMVSRTGRNLTIHREVQDAAIWQSKDDLNDSFHSAVNLLYDAFPQQREGQPMTEEKEVCRRWIQHGIAITTKYNGYSSVNPENEFSLDGGESLETFVKLLANCAWYLFEIADYDECLNLVHTARGAAIDKESLDYAHLENTAGGTYFELNRLPQAREAFETARGIRESKLQKEDADMAIILCNLGNVESAYGNYDEALELFEQAAAIRLKLGDAAAVLLGVNYLQIGRVYFLQGKYTDAYLQYQKCEGLFMKKAGRNAWFLADLVYAYGNLEFAQGDFPAAAQSYERARRICMEYNSLHPLTAAVFYKLACSEFEQDHYTKALGYLEKAQQIAEVRSKHTIDGTMARILWKKAEILLDDIHSGPKKREDAKREQEEMEVRQREIAEALEVDLTSCENDTDRERSFDLMVAGYYR